MDIATLRERIRAVRNAIRHHRDQRGDDRCWIDDDLLYAVVLDLPDLTVLPARGEFLRRCAVFHERRRGPHRVHPSRPATGATVVEDRDLEAMDAATLQRALDHLITGVRAHHAKADAKTWHDDEDLYLLLPERYIGDCSHPDELLANCDRFYECKRAEVERGDSLHPHQW